MHFSLDLMINILVQQDADIGFIVEDHLFLFGVVDLYAGILFDAGA